MLASFEFDPSHKGEEYVEAITRIATALKTSRKIIAVTGAGISVSAGIPDFRSADGLYARVLSSSGPSEQGSRAVKGQDFFDASFFSSPTTRPIFNRFVVELRRICSQGEPTPTHQFLAKLHQEGRLQRWYTQNIDGLERACGLITSTCPEGGKKSVPVISLHGSLQRLVCTMCRDVVLFEDLHEETFKKGESPSCIKCTAFSAERQANGRRPVKGGIMRPDIVLYNEPHPQGDSIAEYLTVDANKRPNVLLVIGTSLKVVGLKKMIKDLARTVRKQPNGIVIFVNKTPAARSEWKTIFDYELLGECDLWMQLLQKHHVKTRESVPTSLQLLTSSPRLRPFLSPSSSPQSSSSVNAVASTLPKRDGRIDRLFKVARKPTSSSLEAKLEKEIKTFGDDSKKEDLILNGSGDTGRVLRNTIKKPLSVQ